MTLKCLRMLCLSVHMFYGKCRFSKSPTEHASWSVETKSHSWFCWGRNPQHGLWFFLHQWITNFYYMTLHHYLASLYKCMRFDTWVASRHSAIVQIIVLQTYTDPDEHTSRLVRYSTDNYSIYPSFTSTSLPVQEHPCTSLAFSLTNPLAYPPRKPPLWSIKSESYAEKRDPWCNTSSQENLLQCQDIGKNSGA